MIITVSGRGGCGKTTLSNELKNTYKDWVYISIDELIENDIFDNSELISIINQKYGTQTKKYNYKMVMESYFSKANDEQNELIHHEFIQFVNYKLNEKLKQYNPHQNIIIDWFLVEKLDAFQIASIKILLDLPQNDRYSLVMKRNGSIDKYKLVDNTYDINQDKFNYNLKINILKDDKQDYMQLINKQINSNNKLVSVIVPVFNTEDYLNKCITSIINQTYKNIELILINDGSSDHSLEICESFAKDDYRIKIINQKNYGVSNARNNGLNNALGDYITFVDSDDYIEPSMISTLKETLENNDADIVDCGINVTLRNGKNFQIHNNVEYEHFDNISLLQKFLLNELNFAVWGKLIKKELIKNVRFENVQLGEDGIFIWNIFKQTNKYIKDGHVLYNYSRRTGNSLTNVHFNHQHMKLMGYANQILSEVETDYPTLIYNAIAYYYGCIVHCLKYYARYIKSDIEKKELYLDELENLNKYYNNLKTSYKHDNISEKYIEEIENLFNEIEHHMRLIIEEGENLNEIKSK